MKNLKLILLMIALYNCTATIALAQEADNASSQASFGKRMVLGVGVSSYVISDKGIGVNLKYDYLLTNKLSIGLKTIITSNGAKDYTTPSDQFGAGYSVDYRQGSSVNFMIASSYCIIGENSNEGKGGVYFTLGAGYSARKMSETATSMAAVSDPTYYKYNRNIGSNNLSGMIGIGGTFKLGPGKVYLELPLTLDFYGKSFTKYTDQQRNSGINQPDKSKRQFQGFYPGVYLSGGYQLNF